MITDMHSHILPALDDGSKSVEESLTMLRALAEQGIRRVTATPHFYAHRTEPHRFLEKRARSWQALQEAMAAETGLPEVKLGAEVYFFHGMSESDALKALTIDGKRCILTEMPLGPWTESMYRELVNIRQKQDLIPIVAHVDRYIAPLRTGGIPERLEQLPVLVQANADFFLRRGTAPMALRMLRRGQIQLLGSDCHNLTDRAPRLGEAVERIRRHCGEEALSLIADNECTVFGEDTES